MQMEASAVHQDGQAAERPVEFVPAEHTDFIFAVTGAELWVGLLALALALAALVVWLRRRRTRDRGDLP